MAFAPRAAFAASYSSGVYSLRIAVRVGGKTRELRAALDLEQEVLVLAGGLRIARALDGVAEILGRQRRPVAVLEIRAQVKGDLGGVVVVLPRLGRGGHRLLVGVESREALIDQLQDIDFGGGRALLRIDHVG